MLAHLSEEASGGEICRELMCKPLYLADLLEIDWLRGAKLV
jgi:hypothetical protein